MTTVLKESRSVVFPATDVEMCIRDALANQAADQAVLRPTRVVPSGATRSWEPEIDSLVVVEVICAVEELLGVELPATFSPKGGLRQRRGLHQRPHVGSESGLGPSNKGEITQ
jgi:acyl carrier protein